MLVVYAWFVVVYCFVIVWDCCLLYFGLVVCACWFLAVCLVLG